MLPPRLCGPRSETPRSSPSRSKEREKLEPAQSSGLKAIQRALPEADVTTFFRDVVKSYRDGNFPLWALTKLDKIDKHNALIPNVAFTQTSVVKLLTPYGQIENSLIAHDVRQEFAFFTGYVPRDAETHYDVEISTDVTFPETALFGNEPVVPALINLSQVTLEALKSFDAFVSETRG